jgi:hypothetical protein
VQYLHRLSLYWVGYGRRAKPDAEGRRVLGDVGGSGAAGDLVMEPGPIEVSVGSSSSDIKSTATVTVTGKPRVIRGEERAFLSTTTVSS